LRDCARGSARAGADVNRDTWGVVTLWRPVWSSLSPEVLGLAVCAGDLLLVLKRGVLVTLAVSAGLSVLAHVFMG